jgi:hypothetical protein
VPQESLGKVAHLMNEHVNDLSDFLTRDQKGKMLPDYQLRLAEVVTAEQQGIIEELGQLAKGINPIKIIVAAQQPYAGKVVDWWSSGFFEGNTEQPSRALRTGRRSMPAPNFTWPAISNLQADFFNQIKQSVQAVGRCRWSTGGKSQGRWRTA